MSYFPLLILLVDTNTTIVVNTVDDIPNNTTFRVLQCNYEES